MKTVDLLFNIIAGTSLFMCFVTQVYLFVIVIKQEIKSRKEEKRLKNLPKSKKGVI